MNEQKKTVVQILLWLLLLLLCLLVAFYVVYIYARLSLVDGPLVKFNPVVSTFADHAVAVYTHIFPALLALLVGPLQFSARLRTKWPAAHRWLGRVYLFAGVLLASVAGFFLAFYAYGGLVSQFGFGLLAVAWFYSGSMAYRTARHGNFVAHRAWMVRNFSLTLAAVSLRVYVVLFQLAGVEFAAYYPLLAWLCWVPNLVIAEWVCNHSLLQRREAGATQAAVGRR